MHTPIITGSDAEGAGEMFRVTTLDSNHKSDEPDFLAKKPILLFLGNWRPKPMLWDWVKSIHLALHLEPKTPTPQGIWQNFG